MKQHKMAAIVLVFLMLVSTLMSGVMAGVEDSGAIEADGEIQDICLDIGKNIEYSSPMVSTSTDLTTIRQRPIELHSALYDAILFQENTSITLNLFDDVSIISIIHKRIEYIDGITGLLGNVEGSASGYVVLSLGYDKVYGTILIPESHQKYIIHHDSNTETHYVSEVDVFYMGEEPQRYAPKLIPDIQSSLDEELLSLEPAFNPNPWEEVLIKVGIFYTDAASNDAGGANNLELKVADEFTTTNMILGNSQTRCTLKFGDFFKVEGYSEFGDGDTDLKRFEINNDGYMDEIHPRRETYNLDLVSLIVKDTGTFGEYEYGIGKLLTKINSGYGMTTSASDSFWLDAAYTLVRQDKLGSSRYVFAHEIGHNLGCHHHPDDSQPGPTEWEDWDTYFNGEINDWSAGYRWYIPIPVFPYLWEQNTVMCYYKYGYDWVPYFSNPDVSHNGDPTGTDKHNNARTIRITKHIVASYMNQVSINAAEGGTTSPAAGPYDGQRRGFFNENNNGIRANPNSGWSFYRWHGDVPDENIHDNPLYLFVDGDKVITPEFINVVSLSFSNFQPTDWWTNNQRPTCTIDIEGLQDPHIALDLTSVKYHYSKNGGVTWITKSVDSCTYKAGLDWLASATVSSVPFDQDSMDKNKIQFSARDVNGNERTSQTFIVKIDTALPTSSVTVSSAYWRNSAIVLDATANDACGIKEVSLWYRRSADNATWGAWTQFSSAVTTSPYQWTFKWPAGQGYYQFYSKAKDNANRIESTSAADVKYGYETISPSAPTLASPNHGITFTISVSSTTISFSWNQPSDGGGSGVYQYQLQIDDSSGFGSPNYNYYTSGTTYGPSIGLGTWYWRVKAGDKAGNWGAFSSYRSLSIVQQASDPGDGGETCFIAGTLISTPAGSKSIENLASGDAIFSYNEDLHQIEHDAIDNVYMHTVAEYLLINGELGITGNHPVYTQQGIISAGDLKVGDIMIGYSVPIEVTSIKRVFDTVVVYNLEVSVNHNYFADEVLVHNKAIIYDPPPGGWCPYVYVWNGTDYVEENNLIPESLDYGRDKLNVDDYYVFLNEMVPKNGKYAIELYENWTERSNFDEIKLITVDYDGESEISIEMNNYGKVETTYSTVEPQYVRNDEGVEIGYHTNNYDELNYEAEGNETILIGLEIEGCAYPKLVIHHKTGLYFVKPNLYYPNPLANPNLKCSIHVQANISGEWEDIETIPSRMNWIYDCVNLTSIRDYLADGGEIRLVITGRHYIDFIAADISGTHTTAMSVSYLLPVSAKYGEFNETEHAWKILQTDGDYLRMSPGQRINIEFPYIPNEYSHRATALMVHGHYYFIPTLSITQPVMLETSFIGSSSGNATVAIDEVLGAITYRRILQQTIDLSQETNANLAFEQEPEKSYWLAVSIDGCPDSVEVRANFHSFKVSELVTLICNDWSNEILYNLDDILWNVTGVDFNAITGRYEVMRGYHLLFEKSREYQWNLSYTDSIEWGFGDGIQSDEVRPLHVYNSLGVFVLNLSFNNDIHGFLLSTFAFIEVLNSPPRVIMDSCQSMELTLTVAGRKGNTVGVRVYEDGILIRSFDVTRTLGQPDTITLDFNRYLGRDYGIELVYEATHGGTNPTWLEFSSGDESLTHFKEFDTKDDFTQTITIDSSYLDEVVAANPAYRFDASDSYDVDGEIVSYEWDFGDGTVAQGMLAEHTYTALGTYEVTLTVTDGDGLASTVSMMVTYAIPVTIQPLPGPSKPPF